MNGKTWSLGTRHRHGAKCNSRDHNEDLQLKTTMSPMSAVTASGSNTVVAPSGACVLPPMVTLICFADEAARTES